MPQIINDSRAKELYRIHDEILEELNEKVVNQFDSPRLRENITKIIKNKLIPLGIENDDIKISPDIIPSDHLSIDIIPDVQNKILNIEIKGHI